MNSEKKTAKENIMFVAMDLFAQNGYHRTPTVTICEKANISTGLLFYHFGSKEGLLESIVEMLLSKLDDIFNLEDYSDPNKMLEAIIDGFYESLKKNKPYWNLYMSLLYQPDTKVYIIDLVLKHSKKFRDKVYRIMEMMGSKDPGADSFEFEIFRVGVFASYLSNHNDKVLEKARQQMKSKYLNKPL